jgi:hypothetical protein
MHFYSDVTSSTLTSSSINPWADNFMYNKILYYYQVRKEIIFQFRICIKSTISACISDLKLYFNLTWYIRIYSGTCILAPSMVGASQCESEWNTFHTVNEAAHFFHSIYHYNDVFSQWRI